MTSLAAKCNKRYKLCGWSCCNRYVRLHVLQSRFLDSIITLWDHKYDLFIVTQLWEVKFIVFCKILHNSHLYNQNKFNIILVRFNTIVTIYPLKEKLIFSKFCSQNLLMNTAEFITFDTFFLGFPFAFYLFLPFSLF